MKTTLIIFNLFFCNLIYGQIEIKQQDSTINKWIHATINIECFPSYQKNILVLRRLLTEKKIDTLQSKEEINRLRSTACSGTAIFFTNKGQHYLLTARHVIEDTTTIDSLQLFGRIVLIQNATSKNNISGVRLVPNGIYIDNIEGTETLSFFPYSYKSQSCYILSNNDLGIIHLERAVPDGHFFIDRLYKLGYVPINLSDIDISCKIKKSDKIYAIGYPEEATIDFRKVPEFLKHMISNSRVLPMVTNGQISSEAKNSDFFKANIFVYHGNSGGPIIKNNKLIGIVHGPSLNLDTVHSVLLKDYITWEALLIKSSLISPLLMQLESNK